uniref:Uncharacterized protein n=1 Tax=Ixodes ricinus TaxID=34613 RepID=A0A6B0U2V1_IXORI
MVALSAATLCWACPSFREFSSSCSSSCCFRRSSSSFLVWSSSGLGLLLSPWPPPAATLCALNRAFWSFSC